MYLQNVIIRKRVVKTVLFEGIEFEITLDDVRKAITAFPEMTEIFQATTVRQWEWNARSRYYSHKGKRISPSEMYQTAEFIQAKAAAKIQQLNFEGEWKDKARQEIKEEFIRQYILGRGGIDQMTSTDWGRIGHALRTQYQYFKDIETRNYSDKMLANVLTLYTDAATSMYERARAATYAIALPAYPGDGSTECHSRCNCTWEYEKEDGLLVAYWTLGPVETIHCETCLEREKMWAPFIAGVSRE